MEWVVLGVEQWLALDRFMGEASVVEGATAIVLGEARDEDGDLVADVSAPLVASMDVDRYIERTLSPVLDVMLDVQVGPLAWKRVCG